MLSAHRIFSLSMFTVLCSILLFVSGCGNPDTSSGEKTFVVGAIPDQNVSDLNRRFELFSNYLEKKTGLNVEYVPSNSYSALVQGFRRGEVHLGWFGGLTGVQARSAVPGSEAIAQRKRDESFHSKFIARTELKVEKLSDLRGKTFTFGSESSTSGHLMPRHYLIENGINPEEDFAGEPNYSGSHDRTWQLVEAGSFDAGALNEAVWQRAVEEGEVDTNKVRAFWTTPPYFDYNWTIHAQVDEIFGQGTKQSIQEALVNIEDEEIMKLFAGEQFIATRNENYNAIRDVAEKLGIIQ